MGFGGVSLRSHPPAAHPLPLPPPEPLLKCARGIFGQVRARKHRRLVAFGCRRPKAVHPPPNHAFLPVFRVETPPRVVFFGIPAPRAASRGRPTCLWAAARAKTPLPCGVLVPLPESSEPPQIMRFHLFSVHKHPPRCRLCPFCPPCRVHRIPMVRLGSCAHQNPASLRRSGAAARKLRENSKSCVSTCFPCTTTPCDASFPFPPPAPRSEGPTSTMKQLRVRKTHFLAAHAPHRPETVRSPCPRGGFQDLYRHPRCSHVPPPRPPRCAYRHGTSL